MRDTLILFTSDHGEFLGDRGLGEKELLYDEIVRVPMIVRNPDPAADACRGTACERLVEAVDIVPTILDAMDVSGDGQRIEGRSLLPLTRGDAIAAWRDATFAELDYAFRRARLVLGRGVHECRAYMVRDRQWKLVHWQGFRPQLFDLAADPGEFDDLGADPRFAAERARMSERLFDWLAARKRRTHRVRAAHRRAHRCASTPRHSHRHLVIPQLPSSPRKRGPSGFRHQDAGFPRSRERRISRLPRHVPAQPSAR